jgi:hypothetical protein
MGSSEQELQGKLKESRNKKHTPTHKEGKEKGR